MLISVILGGCTDSALEPIPPPPPPLQDNLITIKGEVCSEPADITPFPIKILFALDQSASLQCTDSTNRRFQALREAIDGLMPLPNAYFGFVGFASWSRKQSFTRSQDEIRRYLDPGSGLGPATDYQGALASTLQMLEQDMVDSGPAQRARTRYLVVFMSDGIPEPRCNAGCEDDRNTCADGRDSDGDGLVDTSDPDCQDLDDNSIRPDNLYPVCNTDRQIPEGSYVDMAGRCPEYNQPRQILQRVEELRTLELLYSAGEVTLHSVFITSPQEVIDMVCGGMARAMFGYDAEKARDLLSEMARVGGGNFRDVNIAEDDTAFLDFDFTSLRTPYHATEFLAFNTNAVPSLSGVMPDSDGDGMGDADESDAGTRADNIDSDPPIDAQPTGGEDDPNGMAPGPVDETFGDGYTDLFETRFRGSGFDALDRDIPALRCSSADDTDGDGLRDCEEEFLGTDPSLPDTDGDRIVDGLELNLGTDPLVYDSDEDPDFDGLVTRLEVQANTHPMVVDDDRYRRSRVRYTMDDKGELPIVSRDSGEEELRYCYDYQVAGVELAVTTQAVDRGRNRIYLQVFGEPLGLSGSRAAVRQACIEVRYPGEGTKRPASGLVDLSPAGFAVLRDQLVGILEPLSSCLDVEQLVRPDLEQLIEDCVPVRQQVGRVLFSREQLIDLVRSYYGRDLSLKLPDIPSDMFWPIEIFDPERHCFKAWEVERITELMALLDERCAACDTGIAARPPSPPSAGTDESPPDAGGAQP